MVSSPPQSVIQSGTFSPRERPVKLTCNVIMATLVACLGPLSFGYVLGYASPVEEQLKDEFHWSNDSLSWFNSINALGALQGSMLGLYSTDKFGRKLTIMLCSVPLVAGWVMVASSKSAVLLYVGRIITGVGMGAVSLTVPVYIAEIAPAKYRGTLGSGNQLAVTLGLLVAYCLGPLFDSWRWLAIAGAVPPALMVTLMVTMPETPRWLIRNGQISDAIRVLENLQGISFEESEEECQDIKNSLGTAEKVSLSEIKNPSVYRPLVLAVMLMIFQQFGGVNTTLTYASQIFSEAGFTHPTVTSIIIAVVQFVATAISCLIVDKLGRRVLLIYPGVLMSASMLLLGFSSYYRDSGFPSSLTVISLSLYITGFSLGWGPIPWLAMSEIFPTRVRGMASGVATFVNWLGVFVVVKTFTQIEVAFHPYGAYWFYAAICLLSAIYVFIFFPETKKRTLEEIEEMFSNVNYMRFLVSRGYGGGSNG